MISVIITCFIISISCLFYLVIRPIRMDGQLKTCTASMWSLYGSNDELYAQKIELCALEFKH